MSPLKFHNALAATVQAYQEALEELLNENAMLRRSLEQLGQQLKDEAQPCHSCGALRG